MKMYICSDSIIVLNFLQTKMKRYYSIALIIGGLLLAFSYDSYGQKYNPANRYFSIGGCLNAMNYIGDLDPGPSFVSPGIKFTRYNFGVTALYRVRPRVSFRGTISWGRIAGSDEKNSNYAAKNITRKYRNLSFRNDIIEVKADVVIDLFENRGKYNKRVDYTPYVFVGIAYFHHNPKAQTADGNWVSLRDLSTEGQGLDGGPKKYSLNQIALPIGVGFRYKLAKHLDLAFEIGWRFTTTDYIDDVGGDYYDKEKLRAAKGDLAVAMSDRSAEGYATDQGIRDKATLGTDANGNVAISGYGSAGDQRGDRKGRKDVYIITGFHLTYIIPAKVICPKFR
jgi:hypothetical protein